MANAVVFDEYSLGGPLGQLNALVGTTANEADYLLFDDFSSPGLLHGKAPKIGPANQTWQEKNLATSAPVDGVNVITPNSATVTKNGLTSPSATPSWSILRLDAIPGEMGFTFTLADNATTYTPTIACWAGGIMANVGGVHLQVANNVAGAYLLFPSSYYQGGVGVGANNWDDQQSGFGRPVFTPGAVYSYRVFVQTPWTYHVLSDANGNIVGKMLAFNTNLSAVVGPWFFIEMFSNTAVTYKSVWARKQAGNSLSIRALPGGLDSTPVGMRDPAPARFTSMHLGPASVTPAGVFGISYDGSTAFTPPGVNSIANGNGVWEIKSSSNGAGAELWLTNFSGTDRVKLIWGGNYTFTMQDHTGTAIIGKRFGKTPYLMTLTQAVNDAAAATAGVGVGELYANGSAVMQRVA